MTYQIPLFLLSLVIKLTKQTFSKELFSFDFSNLATTAFSKDTLCSFLSYELKLRSGEQDREPRPGLGHRPA